MTSASELFYCRRSRLGRNAAVPELGFDPSASSSSSDNYRRGRENNHRHEFPNGCSPPRRAAGGRHSLGRLSHSDLSLGRLELALGIRNHSERLPRSVLLARERLLERLRGVSLSENRRSSRDSSGFSQEQQITGNEPRPVDTGNWEPEISSILPRLRSSFWDFTLQTEGAQFPQEPSKKKPPGLTEKDICRLYLEVFKDKEKDMKGMGSKALLDCCICLESFLEGDELICLPCEHRFHAACLKPWIATCGDCPYCRCVIARDTERA